MKKYKLKKDLPRAKAGSMVIITNAHSKSPGIVKINKWNEDEGEQPRLAYIHIREMNEWLEEIPEKPKTIFDLEKGDKYYHIDTEGCVSYYYFIKDRIDIASIEIGNAFMSEEETKKELEKRKAIQRIKKYCLENGIELADKDFLYSYKIKTEILYSFIQNKFLTNDFQRLFNGNFITFKNKIDAEKVIENCEKDLKIIFDI